MAELQIIYKDDDIVVVDKPRGMLVHPVREPHPREEIAMKVIRDQLGQKVYTVHRLDRPTSGLLLFALNIPAVRIMQALFEEREVSKKYVAVVHGKTPENWDCDQPLLKEENNEMKDALTNFRRLCYKPAGSFEADETLEVSVVEASPHTGRFHQIRRHLAENGFPIVGDYLYGNIEHNNDVAGKSGISRMMLMSTELAFKHPVTKEKLVVTAPFSDEFAYFMSPSK